jgi:hypothetical protein
MIAKKLRRRFSWRPLLIYVYFEDEPGRRSAAKLLSKEFGVRSLNSVEQPVVGWGNIRSVLMRKHTLTGWHVQ